MKLKTFEFNKEYSISGCLVTIAHVLRFGRGLLRGVQVITFESKDNRRFKTTLWADGSIFRVKEL